jgi:Vanillate O-demethylase oxygenase C-terminal domain
VIFGQDQRIVESQRPEQVPFDLADELHLKFDAVAVAYRRAMRNWTARNPQRPTVIRCPVQARRRRRKERHQ